MTTEADGAVRAVMSLAQDLRERLGENMQGYSSNYTDEGQVRAAFVAKFGHEPERCVRAGPIWLAGPVRGNDVDTN